MQACILLYPNKRQHASYQSSRPCGFREDFFKLSSKKSILSLCDLDMHWTGTI